MKNRLFAPENVHHQEYQANLSSNVHGLSGYYIQLLSSGFVGAFVANPLSPLHLLLWNVRAGSQFGMQGGWQKKRCEMAAEWSNQLLKLNGE